MRADVAHRAQLSGPLGLEAPVPVGRLREPVLQVAAVDVPDLAQLACADARARLLHDRVEADVEVRAVDEARLLGALEKLRRLLGGQRERLLADDVLAGFERRQHLRVVEVVRRREVHDVDLLVGEHGLVRLVDRRDPFAAARSGVEPTTPATSIPSLRSASTWTTPMKPVPTTPALSSLISRLM